jgi:hypothetical protein
VLKFDITSQLPCAVNEVLAGRSYPPPDETMPANGSGGGEDS